MDFVSFNGGPFDVVCCFEVIEHLETPPDQAVAKLATWVKPSGRAYASIPVDHPDRTWHRHVFPTVEAVARLWRAQFEIVAYDPAIRLWVLKPRVGVA